MNQKEVKKTIILDYFNQGSESLLFYKNCILRYLDNKIGIVHIELLKCISAKFIAIFLFPFHLLFEKKKELRTTWQVINQLNLRRYQNKIYKKLIAFFLWEFRFLHFKISVFMYRPKYFLCADSSYFLLRWINFCKKMKIIVIRDFTDNIFSFSILRLNNSEIRINYDFNADENLISNNKLKLFKSNFNNRLKGISDNIDYVLANKPHNKIVSVNSSRIKVLLAAHIFGDAPFTHISFFKDFYEWINFFIKFFNNKRDKYKLIIKEHPSVERYMETGLLSSIVLNSKFYNDDIDIISYDSQIPYDKVDIVITGNGSIGHEYIFRKKPIFNTSEGFCSKYKGCFFAKDFSDIKNFFSNEKNVNKLKIKSILNNNYNIKQSYIFHQLPNLKNNNEFKTAIEKNDFKSISNFFDKNNLLDFIFNDDNINHYFILKPELVS